MLWFTRCWQMLSANQSGRWLGPVGHQWPLSMHLLSAYGTYLAPKFDQPFRNAILGKQGQPSKHRVL